MPRYTINDPDSGQTVTLEGDSPPTEQELEQIFSTVSKPKTDIFRGPTESELQLGTPSEFLPQTIKPAGFNIPILRAGAQEQPETPDIFDKATEAAKTGWEVLNTPIIQASPEGGMILGKDLGSEENLKEIERIAKEGTPLEKRALGVRAGIDQFLSGMTSPLSVATVGAAGVLKNAPSIGRALSALFAVQTGKSLAVDTAKALGEEYAKPANERDPQRIAELWTSAGFGAGLAATLGTHAIAGERAPLLTTEKPFNPIVKAGEWEGPIATGQILSTPSGFDLPLLGPERPTAKQLRQSTLTQRDIQVPETPAEPRESAVDTIRRVGAKTIAQIQQTFPSANLSREQARELRNLSWGTQPLKAGEQTYATQEGIIPEGNIIQRAGTDAQRQTTETGGGNRPVGSPPSEALPAQQPQAVESSNEIAKFVDAFDDPSAKISNASQSPDTITTVKTGLAARNIADLDEMLTLTREAKLNVEAVKKKLRLGNELTPEDQEAFQLATRIQYPREVVETATNTGSWAEGGNTKLGIRPLDWRNNPEVAQWLKDNAKELGITLPESLSQTTETPGQAAAPKVGETTAPVVPDKSEPGPGVVGMGGATPSELVPGTGQDIYSIAQAGREARAAAGQVAPVKPGQGTTMPDSIEHGRELLGKDATAADKALAEFEADPEKAVSANGIAVTRAKGEELSLAARRIEEKFGTDSPEYRVAWKALSDWDARTKPMQTEWQKMGVAQQGATDIDTGSITGLQRAYKENTGQDFNPSQVKQAGKHVEGIKKADAAAETAKPVLQTAIDKMPEPVKTPDDIPGQRNTFAGYESGKPMSDAQIKVIWKRAKSYIDTGMDDKPAIIHKVASDLGIDAKDVLQGMAKTRQVKRVADDVWQKQRQARILKDLAKRWVYKANETWASKIIPVAARSAFAAKTGLHGTVAMGTHAPLVVATHPKIFTENFGKMYKLVASPEYYQMQQYELARRPNYNVAQRGGLVNDMSKMEDFSDPNITQGFPKLASFFKSKLDKVHLGRFVGMGTRGYSVLKILRQDLFDHEWNKLADSDKSPEMAKAIADTVNHITGVVKSGAPTGAHYALFAPKLLLSRLAVVGRDPAIAANSLLKMENMSPSEKWFLKNQVKEKAKVFTVATGLLAVNQALNTFLGDKKKLNGVPESLGGAGFDPMKSDFMKFRVAGMNFAWGSPFLTMMRLPLRIIRIGMGDGGKSKNLIYPDESMAYEAFKYARTQESPFLNPIVSLVTKADYAGRPLPQIPGYGPPPPVPKRLAAQGVKPYTWTEFVAETVLPIPFQEGAKEIFHYAASGDDDKEKALMKGFLTTLIMSATGGRVGEDWDKPQTPVRRALVQQ